MTAPSIQAQRIAAASAVISGGLAVVKIVVGILAGSTSVVADGVESAGDFLASGIVAVSLMVAARPPDDNHPYGHGRMETISGLAVGVLLTITGTSICASALFRLQHLSAAPHSFGLWPLIASIMAKSTLSTLKFRVARRIGSAALTADAWNDTVDILSGVVALAALGLTVADPGRFLAADSIGGGLVGLIVIFLGVKVVRETVLTLMDTMPDERTLGEIRRVALTVPGALGVEKCFARKTGFQYHVDLHLEVDPSLTVSESHQIAGHVRRSIQRELPWVADVLVHVEPHDQPVE